MHKHSVLKCLHIPWAKGMETIQCDLSDQSNLAQTAAAQALLLAAIFMPAEEEGRCLTWLCFCCDLGSLLFLPMTQKLEKGQPGSKGQIGKAQEIWCCPSNSLPMVFTTFDLSFLYLNRDMLLGSSLHAVLEMKSQPPITDLKSLKELWANSMHHVAYLDKIHWHFVSQCCSHVAWGTRDHHWSNSFKLHLVSLLCVYPCEQLRNKIQRPH